MNAGAFYCILLIFVPYTGGFVYCSACSLDGIGTNRTNKRTEKHPQIFSLRFIGSPK